MKQMAWIILGLVCCMALYATFLSPWAVDDLTEGGRLSPPSETHWFGTDHLSRDVFTRVGAGTLGTLGVACGTVLIGATLGTLLGSISAYFGGWLDWILSRLTDALLAFPGILMALLIMTVFGRGLPQVTVALGIAFTPSFARVVRSAVAEIRGRNYIRRLEVMGAHPVRILRVHILPLLRSQLLDAMTLGMANAILAESSLSFIGFGVQPPQPSWGGMLSDAQAYWFNAPWLALFPGLTIVSVVLALFMLRNALKKRRNGGAQ